MVSFGLPLIHALPMGSGLGQRHSNVVVTLVDGWLLILRRQQRVLSIWLVPVIMLQEGVFEVVPIVLTVLDGVHELIALHRDVPGLHPPAVLVDGGTQLRVLGCFKVRWELQVVQVVSLHRIDALPKPIQITIVDMLLEGGRLHLLVNFLDGVDVLSGVHSEGVVGLQLPLIPLVHLERLPLDPGEVMLALPVLLVLLRPRKLFPLQLLGLQS
mmetsp:Transcript_10396/g.10407  ORF Transcript_10396/g.10407 Transcript_10396/m.10407 type:complete len:213 (-) Transcript_10396:2074-2712(-)